MRRVLFDTNIVSSWHDADPEWASSLEAVMRELGKHGAELGFFVASVTVQELMFHAYSERRDDDVGRWLRETFTPLTFDDDAARMAAQIQLQTGRPEKVRPKSEDKKAVDLWVRDCAILGIAIRHKIDVVVTADQGLYRRRERFSRSILLVRTDGVFHWGGYRDPA